MHRQTDSHGSAGSIDAHYSTPLPLGDEIRPNAWNKPRGNLFRTLASFYGFLVMGMHGPAFGALLPYIAVYYNLSYTIISLVFLPNFCGYVSAAATTGLIHDRLGRRGIAIIAPVCQIIAYLIICARPPFSIIVVALIIVGYGIGLQDSAWNAYVGDLENATEVMGVLQGLYGLGAIVGPLVATLMVTQAHLEWFAYYYLMLCASVVTLLIAVPSFWTSTARTYHIANTPQSTPRLGPVDGALPPRDSSEPETLKDIFFRNPRTSRIIRLTTFFIICYVAAETAISGWIVTYFLNYRHAEPTAAGLSVSGFWFGLCLGRAILGFVTPRLGERRAIAGYALLALLLEAAITLLPGVGVPAALVALQGFFLGPMFPAGVLILTSQLPKHAHVQGLAAMCSCGAAGGTVFPFIVGALAEAWGIRILMPLLLVGFTAMLGCWLLVSGVAAQYKKEDEAAEQEQEQGEQDGERRPLLGAR